MRPDAHMCNRPPLASTTVSTLFLVVHGSAHGGRDVGGDAATRVKTRAPETTVVGGGEVRGER